MDIFKFAMEKEKLSEQHYRRLAERTSNAGLRNICLMLADEEAKHYRTVQGMQHRMVGRITETPVLKEARETFESMRRSAESFDPDTGQLELYEKARDIEQKSRDFYLEKAAQVADPQHKGVFKKLADEEQKHYFLIDNICDFVARPRWFLENAEMYRWDDYAGGVL